MNHVKSVLLLSVLLVVSAGLLIGCGSDKSTQAPCYTITVGSVGMGGAAFSPDSACYHSGTVVTITAVPDQSWLFDGWTGDTTTANNPLVVTVGGNISLTMAFTQGYLLTANIDPAGGGSVALDPNRQYFRPGETVTIDALPSQSYGFSHWIYGSEVRTEDPTSITFGEADESIDVYFGSLEGEPVCGDEYEDTYNGGCNSTPEVFSSIQPDQLILGQGGNYIYQTFQYRDTDWYEYDVNSNRTINFSAVAEFDLQIAIIDGTNGCISYSVLDITTVPAGDTASLSVSVGAGTYWMWVGTSGFTGWPCPQNYECWMTLSPALSGSTPTQGRPAAKGEFRNIR